MSNQIASTKFQEVRLDRVVMGLLYADGNAAAIDEDFNVEQYDWRASRDPGGGMNLSEYGIALFDVSTKMDSSSENDGSTGLFIYARGEEFALVSLECPSYCDDEHDAWVGDIEVLDGAGLESKLSELRIELGREMRKHEESVARSHAEAIAAIKGLAKDAAVS